MKLLARLFRRKRETTLDPETHGMTLGQLMQAALNVDILVTAGDATMSPRDKEYLAQQAERIDDELERRGHTRYADL